jgi:hypothetical protein
MSMRRNAGFAALVFALGIGPWISHWRRLAKAVDTAASLIRG